MDENINENKDKDNTKLINNEDESLKNENNIIIEDK